LSNEFPLWRLGFANFDRDIRPVITVVQKITQSATVTCLSTLKLLGMHSRPSDIYRLSKCAEPLKIVEAKPCQHNPVNEKSFNGIISSLQTSPVIAVAGGLVPPLFMLLGLFAFQWSSDMDEQLANQLFEIVWHVILPILGVVSFVAGTWHYSI
jgi:hypothetical protein